MTRYVIQINFLNADYDEIYFKNLLPNLKYVWIARDSHTHEPKKYGFLEFDNKENMIYSINYIKENNKNIFITEL